MKIYDTHMHLNRIEFKGDEQKYMDYASEKGVGYFNVIGWDLDSSIFAIKQAHHFKNTYAVIGIHPCDVFAAKENDLDQIENLIKDEKVVAYGEIGLDYHWYKEDKDKLIQKEWLIRQINLANKHKMPIVFHVRDAIDDLYEVLKNNRPLYSGVVHCFSGNYEQALKFIELGLYIGIDGPLTFKKNTELKNAVALLPIDKLLVETDSPFLAPVPYRGKQNHSMYLPLVIEEISRIKNMEFEDIVKATTKNAFDLFHVKR